MRSVADMKVKVPLFQIMETFSEEEKEKQKSLNQTPHVDVEPTHNNDVNALVPAIETAEQQDLNTKELTADSLYSIA